MSKPLVLITVAGQNSRLYPFNSGVHKSGLTLLGQPLLIRTIQAFIERSYHKFVIVISPQDSTTTGIQGVIQEFLPKLDVTFVTQSQPDGMGNAVLAAQEHLSDSFIYTSGYHLEAAELADRMETFGTPNVVCSAPTTTPWEYGILSLVGDLAMALTEKPEKGTERSNQKIQTIYKLDQHFLSLLAQTLPIDDSFEVALDQLMKQTQVSVLKQSTSLPSLKYPWDLFDLQSSLLALQKSRIDSAAQLSKTAIIDESQGAVVIEKGAVLGDFVKLVGPCYIGELSFIGDYSFIRHSSIEAHTQIGAKTEVVRSIIFSHSSVHFGYLADSIIGNQVKIGAGLLTANKRLDRTQLSLKVKGKDVETARENLGVLIGDQASLGINVSTMPGVIIGPRAVVYPSLTVYQAVAADETLKTTSLPT